MSRPARYGLIVSCTTREPLLHDAHLLHALAAHWRQPRFGVAACLLLSPPALRLPAGCGWQVVRSMEAPHSAHTAALRRARLTAAVCLTTENLLLPDGLLQRVLCALRDGAAGVITAGFPRGIAAAGITHDTLNRLTGSGTLPQLLAHLPGTRVLHARHNYVNRGMAGWDRTGRVVISHGEAFEHVPEFDLRPQAPDVPAAWLMPRPDADGTVRVTLPAMIAHLARAQGDRARALRPRIRVTPGPPRVLLVNHLAVQGGAELSLLAVARGLRARGWQAQALFFAAGPMADACRAHDIPTTIISEVGSAERQHALDQLLQRFRPGLAVGNSAQVLPALLATAPRLGIPCVGHIREFLAAEKVIRSGLHSCHAVIANSEHTAAYLRGLCRGVTVVHNGIDKQAVRRAALAARPAPRPRRRFVFGVFGRLAPYKGQHTAIAALRLLCRTVDAHLLMVGGDCGLPGGAGYAALLRERAAAAGLRQRVTFVPHTANPYPLMAACDALALPTEGEPFGRVVLEAMALGLPVIATNDGGPAELLPAGYLVPSAEPQALADKLAQAAAGALPAPSFPARFTLARCLDGIEHVFRSVLALC